MSRDLPDPMKDPALRKLLAASQAQEDDPERKPAVETITLIGTIKAVPASGPAGRGAAIVIRTGRQDIRQYQYPMGLGMAKGLHDQLGAVLEQAAQQEQTAEAAAGNGKPDEPESDAAE